MHSGAESTCILYRAKVVARHKCGVKVVPHLGNHNSPPPLSLRHFYVTGHHRDGFLALWRVQEEDAGGANGAVHTCSTTAGPSSIHLLLMGVTGRQTDDRPMAIQKAPKVPKAVAPRVFLRKISRMATMSMVRPPKQIPSGKLKTGWERAGQGGAGFGCVGETAS